MQAIFYFGQLVTLSSHVQVRTSLSDINAEVGRHYCYCYKMVFKKKRVPSLCVFYLIQY